jgi:subfamily B ATP-binding cassette protein MsbA
MSVSDRLPRWRRRKDGLPAFVRGLVAPYGNWLAIVLAAMFVETAASLAAPWPLKIVIDSAVGHHPLPRWLAHLVGPAIAHDKIELAGVCALGLAGIAAIGAVASYIDNYYTESVGQWVANDLRLKVYAHLEHLSLNYYDTHQTGTLLSTMVDDVATIQDFASSSTLGVLVDFLTIFGMVGVMFWLNFDFTLIAVAITPFLLLFVTRFKGAVKEATHEVRKRQSVIVNVLEQGLESIRSVKAFGREDVEQQRLAEASRASAVAALKARSVKSLLSPIVSIIVALCTAFVLWRGTALIITGALTVGGLTVFLSYLSKFFKPVQDLAKMTNAIAQTAVGVDRVRAVLDVDDVLPQRENGIVPTTLRGDIAFRNVAFSYDPQAPVLRDVTFSIASGQVVGIVGATGGGKSTILSLIPRFYDVTAGAVSIDGVDVREYDIQALRAQIAFVLQDTVLFRGTIRENIAYGRPEATFEEIVAAATAANAHQFISEMPDGYDTAVGERGLTLSGGQRQRIGIARALVRNSPVLLLDEPTAALDTESEQSVIEATKRLMQGRTVVTIAHRLSTIRDADTIIVLSGGVVAEQGSHAELIARNGIYAELYHIQFGSPEPAAAAAP